MDRYEALKMVDDYYPNKKDFEKVSEAILIECVEVVCSYLINWLYDKNYEIIERTVDEEYVKESQKKTTR